MILVVGFGNPLRGDDGAGQAVAERVRQLGMRDVQVVASQQLLPEFADMLAHAILVVFVDAAVGEEPGRVYCTPVRRSTEPQPTHALSPAALLRLTRETWGWEPPAWLVRITGQAFEFSEGLSEPVARAIPHAVNLVERLIPGD
jgi:hydrogenase maturation protease